MAAMIRSPTRDIQRLRFRHHFALSKRISSVGANWRAYSLKSLELPRLLVLFSASRSRISDMGFRGSGRNEAIIQAIPRVN